MRRLGRKGWKKTCPEPAWFVLGREKGKLSYFWRHVFTVAKPGQLMGSLVMLACLAGIGFAWFNPIFFNPLILSIAGLALIFAGCIVRYLVLLNSFC